MVLYFDWFYFQVLNMLTIHFSCSLYIPTVIYIFDMFLINHILACLTQGHIKVPGGECHGMCLGATVSHSTKGVWDCLLWHLCSEWGYPLSIPGACTNISTKKSMMSSGHHVMMSDVIWWYSSNVEDWEWWHVHQYWKGIKRRMHEREGFQIGVS